MSGKPRDKRGVNRLLDIVVEEVSLVDRAANKHRFLIVKRSDDMDEDTNAGAAGADESERADDLAADLNSEGTEGTEDQGETTNEAAGDSTLTVALEALEGLTEAVELLGAATQDTSQTRLGELAGELRTVSERLSELAGAAPESSGSATGSGSGTASTSGADPITTTMESVRTTLERVSALLDAGAGAGATSEETAANDSDETSAEDEASAGLPAQLGELATALRTLTDTVREQQQRLARLEKRSGLPNSAPSGEQPRRAEDEEDVSWPLDLNRGLDRESVDKTISFHDV